MKTIGITGGSGFVGQHLARLLVQEGCQVVIFTREPADKKRENAFRYAAWDPAAGTIDTDALKTLDAVVHLAGAGIADKRWTQKRKQELINSRTHSTRFLVAQLRTHAPSCRTFVSASATGYYGADTPGMPPFSEDAPAATDFLAQLCADWEAAAASVADFAQVVICRFGIVLGRESGAFPSFKKPLHFGIAPVLGNGRQVVSWIHVADLAALLLHVLQKPVAGIFNAVAPAPVTQKELIKTIAKEKGGLHITAYAPAFVLKAILGEMAGELLKSCTVSCDKIRSTGFRFQYPDIDAAVYDLLHQPVTTFER